MQSNDNACRSCAPENPTLTTTTPETSPKRTNALGQLAIKHRKKAIVAAMAIVLIAVFWRYPTLAIGLLFAAGLFGINTLIDSRMAGGDQ